MNRTWPWTTVHERLAGALPGSHYFETRHRLQGRNCISGRIRTGTFNKAAGLSIWRSRATPERKLAEETVRERTMRCDCAYGVAHVSSLTTLGEMTTSIVTR